MMFNEELFDNV